MDAPRLAFFHSRFSLRLEGSERRHLRKNCVKSSIVTRAGNEPSPPKPRAKKKKPRLGAGLPDREGLGQGTGPVRRLDPTSNPAIGSLSEAHILCGHRMNPIKPPATASWRGNPNALAAHGSPNGGAGRLPHRDRDQALARHWRRVGRECIGQPLSLERVSRAPTRCFTWKAIRPGAPRSKRPALI